jgi:ATP-binding cassette subfamily F protein 3
VERQLGPLEAEIGELERRLAELDAASADPEVYRDPARAAQVGRDRAATVERLSRAYEAWEREAEKHSG